MLRGEQDKIILPQPCRNADPSWFGFLITCREGISRNRAVRRIEGCGIQTRMLFAGNLTRHPCFDQMRREKTGYRIAGTLENTDRIMNDTFWAGVYPGLTEQMIKDMARAAVSGAVTTGAVILTNLHSDEMKDIIRRIRFTQKH